MTKIAIIGAGRMGKTHAGNLQKIKDCQICGVYDPVEHVADAFCEQFGIGRKYSSEKEVAEDTSVDGVVICNYTDRHAGSLALQIEAGRNKVFCEKPIVRKMEEAEMLRTLARKQNTCVMVGHHKRYINGFSRLHEIVQSGTLGEVRMAKVNWCSTGYSRNWDDFFADFERSGGAALDMMSHMFDQLNWNFGEPHSITGSSIMLDRSMPQPMDYVSGTLIYKSGPVCNIDCSWQRYGIGSDIFEVYGDVACAILRGGEDKLHIYKMNEHTEINAAGSTPIMEAYVDMIRNDTPPLVSLEDGIKSARVSLAMIEAAKSNTVVTFETF